MRILSIILLLFGYSCFAQKTNNDLQVTYQHYIDGDWPLTYPAILYINDSTTIYQTQHRLKEEWSGGKLKLDGESFSTAKAVKDGYMKINHYSKEILYFDQLPTVTVLITDNYPEFSWKISNEKKTVAGYSCIKATANYRGRTWIAWFTPDIAVPYGPWKLHGLPGLILEAYDVNEIFIMRALKIEKTKNTLFSKDFNKLNIAYNKKPITYRQFLANRTEAFENIAKEMSKDGSITTFKEAPRSGEELIYEWEE